MNQMARIAEGAEVNTVDPSSKKLSKKAKAWIVALPLAGILVFSAKLIGSESQASAPPPAPAIVEVSAPLARDVLQWDEYVGRFAPSKAVEVRPRVSGVIVGIHFKDGQFVHQGQLLFTVDPRPYRAALAEANANVASARATLVLARSDYERASRLTGDDAVSASEVDSLRSKLQAASATLAAAQARADSKSLEMQFTQVRAPISGRISDRRIDAGNLVIGGDGMEATLLTTINAHDPIYFSFDASEALFLKAQDGGAKGAGDVEIRLQNETAYNWKGKLDFTDNGVDPKSGTIRGRATISNPGGKLTPGLFGNMRMSNGSTVRALLVPDAAVQTDMADKAVLTVGKDNKVVLKKVVLGPQVDGLRIISSGLAPNDRVIISGNIGAAPGAVVDPKVSRIVPKVEKSATLTTNTPVAAAATFASK